ncbi:carbonic anhydrase, partial [Bacillus cereus]|nr:carbonic anhydrase [Bacillus cereus]
MLTFNEKFLENNENASLEATKIPKKSMDVVTCMDDLLIELLPKALDIHDREAIGIRNAGGKI